MTLLSQTFTHISSTYQQHSGTLQSRNHIIYSQSASSTWSSVWTALRECQTPRALYPCTTLNLKALCRTSVAPGCLALIWMGDLFERVASLSRFYRLSRFFTFPALSSAHGRRAAPGGTHTHPRSWAARVRAVSPLSSRRRALTGIIAMQISFLQKKAKFLGLLECRAL